MSIKKFIHNYTERHMHPTNRLLHLVGVPLTFAGSIYCLSVDDWISALLCFSGGYLLQFLGHWVEQNDPGELILLKKVFHQPFTEFGPLRKE